MTSVYCIYRQYAWKTNAVLTNSFCELKTANQCFGHRNPDVKPRAGTKCNCVVGKHRRKAGWICHCPQGKRRKEIHLPKRRRLNAKQKVCVTVTELTISILMRTGSVTFLRMLMLMVMLTANAANSCPIEIFLALLKSEECFLASTTV